MFLAATKSLSEEKYLCIAFLNTEYLWQEALVSAPQVVDWLIGRGVFAEPADQLLLHQWAREVPAQLVQQFQAVHTDLRQLVTALLTHQPLPTAELARQQALLQRGSRSRHLVLVADQWQVQSRLALPHPASLAVPLAESFAELLTGADSARVKECANPNCTVLFYDTTKNQSRAWCAACGTQVKALRYYHKHKTKPAA